MKGVDKSAPQLPIGTKAPFGELLAEIPTNGWVQSVAWSPSGNTLAVSAQDSTIHFTDISSGTPDTTTVKHRDLPFRDVLFTSEAQAVAVGHDCTPTTFTNSGGWKFGKKVDSGEGAAAGAGKAQSAMNMFKNQDTLGSASNETKLNTKHQNSISCIQAYKGSADKVSHYSTSGLDGTLIIWAA